MLDSFPIVFGRPKYNFMTSLEVIRSVMNVPIEVVHAIARVNGISTADDHANIISEHMLLPFVEAFERKIKNYFENSLRNSAQLTPMELQTFTEFCKTFKKGNVTLNKVSRWSHIGKAKLREYFVNKIKEKTPSLSLHHTVLDLFSGIGGIDAGLKKALYNDVEPVLESSIIKNYSLTSGSEFFNYYYRQQQSQDLLKRITSSWRYYANIESSKYHVVYAQDIIGQIILSARYHVYIDDDDHELLEDARVFYKIRVLKEVA